MELKDLLLRKEEVPILHERNFTLPIYPELLNPNIQIDPNLASKVFPESANEWYEDLKEYVETADLDKEKKEWYNELFLKEKPEVKTEYGHQSILNGSWTDQVFPDPNGFLRGFSISRDFGGSTYFNQNELGSTEFVPFKDDYEGFVRFSEEKARAFGIEEMEIGELKGTRVYVYSLHNVDNYHGALFLRNWGINYMNEAIKSIFDLEK